MEPQRSTGCAGPPHPATSHPAAKTTTIKTVGHPRAEQPCIPSFPDPDHNRMVSSFLLLADPPRSITECRWSRIKPLRLEHGGQSTLVREGVLLFKLALIHQAFSTAHH